LLAHGFSTNEIALLLSIAASPTRNHVRNILQKLQVHSQLEAVIYALQHRLGGKE
jgi:two-component system nitrate/nitrite response regulator NarL